MTELNRHDVNLDQVFEEYQRALEGRTYSLPDYWDNRESLDLPLDVSDLPGFSRIANSTLFRFGSGAFPWGE